jgi:hypothetical protein
MEVDKIVDELLNITDFKTKCVDLINEIWKDKLINTNDIPYFVSLITLIYFKNPIKKIKKENVKIVFKNLLMKLLKENTMFDLLNSDIITMIETFITASLDIVFLNITDLSQSCFSCCKKNIKKEEEYNNMVNELKSSISKPKDTTIEDIKVDIK